MTTTHSVVSQSEWLDARKALLAREKEFTRERDQLSAARRALPWVRIDKKYVFDTVNGPKTLAELFGDRSQLVVYHFMYGADWDAGCKSCSFWADNYNGIIVHLRQRDVTMLAISTAPLATIEAYKKRMGWSFDWVSSGSSSFNHDFNVSFTPEEVATGTGVYNYGPLRNKISELPGVSVFFKDDDGTVFHTYSTYGRGIDMLNGAYHTLDLVPKGRDEDGLPFNQTWVRRHDEYEA